MKKNSGNISIVDTGLTAEGTFTAKGKLIIKGTVKGKLSGENVVIAEEGAVYAVADAVRMTIGGTFDGTLSASEELVILASGNCSGKVTCRNLIVEAGGMLNAEVTSSAAPAAEPRGILKRRPQKGQ